MDEPSTTRTEPLRIENDTIARPCNDNLHVRGPVGLPSVRCLTAAATSTCSSLPIYVEGVFVQ